MDCHREPADLGEKNLQEIQNLEKDKYDFKRSFPVHQKVITVTRFSQKKMKIHILRLKKEFTHFKLENLIEQMNGKVCN